jgi:hypothetical protein
VRSFQIGEEVSGWEPALPTSAAGISSGPVDDLRALGRERRALDRLLGEGLRLFRDRRFDPMDLGHRSFRDLVFNELGLSSSRAYELARVAEGLERYPVLGRAFDAGLIDRSRVVLVLEVAEEETVEGWMRLARRMSVRTFRRVVKAYRHRVRGEHLDDDRRDYERVKLHVPLHIWRFFRIEGREMAESVCGTVLALWQVLEKMCAEIASEFPELLAEVKELEGDGVRGEEPPVYEPTVEDLRKTSGMGREEDGDALPRPVPDLPDPGGARNARELLDVLRALMARRQSLDLRIARSVVRCAQLRIPVNTERILGRSERWARGLVSLFRRMEDLPALGEAYCSGRLGWTKAWLVARISSPETESAWVARAEGTSHRWLEGQVDAMEGYRERDPEGWKERTKGLPPDRALLDELKMHPCGKKIARLEDLKRVADVRNLMEESRARSRTNLGPGWGPPAGEFRAPPRVARLVVGVLRALKKKLHTHKDGLALAFLVKYFEMEYGDEIRRGHQCAVPGCSKRGEHRHHIVYRSRGGGDEAGNIIWLCAAHHLAGEHGGRLKIRGRAPDDVYILMGERLWKGDEMVALVKGKPPPPLWS